MAQIVRNFRDHPVGAASHTGKMARNKSLLSWLLKKCPDIHWVLATIVAASICFYELAHIWR